MVVVVVAVVVDDDVIEARLPILSWDRGASPDSAASFISLLPIWVVNGTITDDEVEEDEAIGADCCEV